MGSKVAYLLDGHVRGWRGNTSNDGSTTPEKQRDQSEYRVLHCSETREMTAQESMERLLRTKC